MNKRTIWIIVGVVLAALCCGMIALGFAGYQLYKSSGNLDFSNNTGGSSQTQKPVPTFAATMVVPEIGKTTDDGALETESILKSALVPNNDPRDLAMRLKGIKDIPETLSQTPEVYKVGDKKEFNAINTDTNTNFKVQTSLVYVTDHAYLWIEDGVKYDKAKVKKLADIFETKIYPTDREFFGSEWTPGVDGDQHLYIIYARGLGDSIAGLFSSIDSINPLARPDSNGHESFYMSADNLNFGTEDYGTLAHEFQHMIHWYRDRNEDTWMNEGFSVVAEFLNHYDAGGFDELYVMNPDQQLTDWPSDPDATRPHYGEAFLFLTYFLDRFGEKATQALVAEPENGMDAIDKVLKDQNAIDPVTSKQITADDVYADWVVALFMKDPKAGDGRFTYKNYPSSPRPDPTEVISDCPTDDLQRSVSQYGVDYIRINCKGNFNINFQGVLETGVVAENPHSGKYSFWSNKGDESDMTLTHTFDFTKVAAPINFDYWLWHDLETDYDFAYLEYSEDGQSWKIIPTMSCTSENKSGNSYGCGWNDKSGGWVKESVDLSFLARKNVQIRFEYITDAAVNGEGLLLDDLSIPAINYQTDFEKDNGGWDAAGFVRIQNQLPQTYRVSLIKNGKPNKVIPIELDASNKAVIPVSIDDGTTSAVLVVSGTTRFSRQEARYQFSLTK
jgi:immune inhibitor A